MRSLPGWIAAPERPRPISSRSRLGRWGHARKPTTRRYSTSRKEYAVRLARQLSAELGTEDGTVQRVAGQLGYGTKSVKSWVAQADIDDGRTPGVSTSKAKRIAKRTQENPELRRANGS